MKTTEYDSNDDQHFSHEDFFVKHGMVEEVKEPLSTYSETEDSDDSDYEDSFDVFHSRLFPSQHSRHAIGETLRWMGCGWGE